MLAETIMSWKFQTYPQVEPWMFAAFGVIVLYMVVRYLKNR